MCCSFIPYHLYCQPTLCHTKKGPVDLPCSAQNEQVKVTQAASVLVKKESVPSLMKAFSLELGSYPVFTYLWYA